MKISGDVAVNLDGTVKIVFDRPTVWAIITARYGSFTVTGKGDGMAYTLPSGKEIELQVSYVDQAGNPAAVDGPVTWASSNTAILTIVAEPTDSTICMATTIGPVGTAQVTATADADLGTGVKSLVTMLDVTVVAGEAVAGTIAPVGEPTPVP